MSSALKTFLRAGRLGIFLGGWYAVGSTIMRYGLSGDGFSSMDFVTRLIVGAVVGFILAGVWRGVLAEVILRWYASTSRARKKSSASSKAFVEEAVRNGLLFGFYTAIATTFAKPGISSDPFLWLDLFFGLAIYLPTFFLVGGGFGVAMLQLSETLETPVDSSGTEQPANRI